MGQTWGFRSTILASAAAVLLGCHPAGIDDASETDTVVTRKAESYDYSRNRTYDIPDSVADLCNIDPSKLPPIGDGGSAGERPNLPDAGKYDCNDITHVFDDAILTDIRKHLEALGYVRVHVADGDKPDVAMLVGAISSNNWVAYTWYPWYPYYGWPPYYGWGIYYPYYPTTSVVNYPTGTLTMDLVSLKDPPNAAADYASVIWSGSISGLLAQGDVDSVTRVDRAIDQAFAQSSYLKVNQ